VAATVEGSETTISVRPICATCWKSGGGGEFIGDPASLGQLDRLRDVLSEGGTVWVETWLEGLSESQREWLEGEYPVWSALPTPIVDWTPMRQVLEAIGLEAPAAHREDTEPGSSRLLRALPFAYSRGAFGTVRDALSEDRVVDELAQACGGAALTAFPTAGFMPGNVHPDGVEVAYTVLHATLSVVGNAVVSVRLPDILCPANSGVLGHVSPRALVPMDVLTRFLPQGRTASGREVAEAIGMHQATSARAVAAQIRDRLRRIEQLAATLNAEGDRKDEKPQLKDEVLGAAKMIDELAETTHQLDRNLSTILRRFGGGISDAPEEVQELVPAEAKRRYGFALDNVRALHEDCRLASQVVRHELTAYEQSQREHFQFVATVLASIVLIPTLIASVLGVNLGVPGEHSQVGFLAFVAAIGGLGVVGYSALRKAEEYNWSPPRRELRPQIAWATAIVIALVAVLLVVS